MKKLSIVCITGLLFFASCENTGSSTVGTYDDDETQPAQGSEGVTKEEPSTHEGMKADTTKAMTDTMHATGKPGE